MFDLIVCKLFAYSWNVMFDRSVWFFVLQDVGVCMYKLLTYLCFGCHGIHVCKSY